jgi:RimJ/RimL family protein N-acetyltransferase
MQVFLETERVILRRFTMADVDLLFKLDGDPEVMRFINGGRPTPRDAIQNGFLRRHLRGYERYKTFGRWAAIEKATGEFLGWFSFAPPEGAGTGEVELGYRLRRAAWGKGYATEVSRALIHKGFTELGVRRVTANTMTVNTASRRVMEKVGLRFVRTYFMEWPEEIEGSEQGDVEYAIEKAEWERQEAANGAADR